MSFVSVQVTFNQPVRSGDGAGGKIEAMTSYLSGKTYSATFHLYQKQSQYRQDEATHNSPGPGVANRTEGFFSFGLNVIPSVLARDWQIVHPNGTVWRVLFVRPAYDWRQQVDVELVA